MACLARQMEWGPVEDRAVFGYNPSSFVVACRYYTSQVDKQVLEVVVAVVEVAVVVDTIVAVQPNESLAKAFLQLLSLTRFHLLTL